MKLIHDWSTHGFAAALVLMGGLGFWSYRAISQQVETGQWVGHSQTVIDQMQTLLTEVERAPADVRGYFLTRDPAFRQALTRVRARSSAELDALSRITSDNPARRLDVPQLRGAINTYLDALDREVATFNARSILPDLEQNRGLLDAVENRVQAIQVDERRLLAQRIEQSREVSRLATSLIEIGSGCALLIIGASFFLAAHATRARRRAEEVLRGSEQRFRFMVGSIKDYAVIMLDARGQVISWNSGAERMKGYRADEIIGRHFGCFYPPELVREGFPGYALAQTEAHGRFEDEGERVRADGSRFLANVKINAVRDEAGRLLGFVKVTCDVTARREIEQRIQRLNQDLAERARQLELSNQELEAFSYSVSHDLRSPLRHIAGFVDLLQKSPAIQKDAAARRQLNIIAKAARQMGLLIDDLLAFSRTGRSEMRVIPTEMRAIVDQVIAELEPEWKDRRVEWDIRPLDPVPADPHLLRLVWTNLISNALKYTRPRELARIEIGQERRLAKDGSKDESRDEIAYYVRDNGVGFNMEYAHKLFGVFQRLHRADEFEGTGIGLANVQRIVHRHGGHVWAEGAVDCGSVFNFSLPRNRRGSRAVLCQN